MEGGRIGAGAFAIVEAAGLGYLYLKDPLTFAAVGVTREVETTLVTPAATPAPAAEASPELTEAASTPCAAADHKGCGKSRRNARHGHTHPDHTCAGGDDEGACHRADDRADLYTHPDQDSKANRPSTVAPTKTSAPTPGS